MKVIVIGTSAGGAEALSRLMNDLPKDFLIPIFIVWHISPVSSNYLPKMLAKSTNLGVKSAENGEKIVPGQIYIAPPDHHLIIDDGKMRVVYGPKENRFRPAIDPLFRSAADAHGPNAIGILLTGMLNDGTSGLWAIKDRGGTTIVQDPDDAQFPDMPMNALNNVEIDYRVPLTEMAKILLKLAAEPDKKDDGFKPEEMGIEVRMTTDRKVSDTDVKKIGEVSEFTCPECHGTLWKIQEGNIIRFRCRTGHAYSVEALLDELSKLIENLVWESIKGLEEYTSLIKYLAEHFHDEPLKHKKGIYLEKAEVSQKFADALRDILTKHILAAV